MKKYTMIFISARSTQTFIYVQHRYSIQQLPSAKPKGLAKSQQTGTTDERQLTDKIHHQLALQNQAFQALLIHTQQNVTPCVKRHDGTASTHPH